MPNQNFDSLVKNKNIFFDNVDLPVTNVQAFQTTRLSPISPSNKTHEFSVNSAYGHFNVGAHVNDNLESVNDNRALLLDYLPCGTSIQWLDQVHGTNVAEINEVSSSPIQADAVITRQKKLALAIMTADCLPILITNNSGSEIAAIHAGWRSLAGGIISKTVDKMTSENEALHFWLGPCIGKHKFEVGEEVKTTFEKLNPLSKNAFIKENNDKWYANLVELALLEINNYDVKSISINGNCTFSESSRYYSYRKQQITGRMASIICIK